jgi:hypothetical protein
MSLFGRGLEFIKGPKKKTNAERAAAHQMHTEQGWMA